eukprot:4936094-Amphidinium_carterae.1
MAAAASCVQNSSNERRKQQVQSESPNHLALRCFCWPVLSHSPSLFTHGECAFRAHRATLYKSCHSKCVSFSTARLFFWVWTHSLVCVGGVGRSWGKIMQWESSSGLELSGLFFLHEHCDFSNRNRPCLDNEDAMILMGSCHCYPAASLH